MDAQQSALYHRIQAFVLDEPNAKITFCQRLARDNRWSAVYAERVIAEYRKFLLLAAVAGHRASPSDAVDQAWHLHLTHSRSYWRELCPKILGADLHHHPNPGGLEEKIKHWDGYNRTLASYESIFGYPPPADVWPPAEIRFGRDTHFVRVNTRQYWLIPKPEFGSRLKRPLAAFAALLLLTTGCSKVSASLDETFAIASLGMALLLYLWAMLGSKAKSIAAKRQKLLAEGKLYLAEVAYLAGGSRRVMDLCLVKLAMQGKININCRQNIFEILPPAVTGHDSPLEEKILRHLKTNSSDYPRIRDAQGPEIDVIRGNLKAKGFLPEESASFYDCLLIAFVFIPLFGLGLTRLHQALVTGNAVGVPLFTLIVTSYVLALLMSGRNSKPYGTYLQKRQNELYLTFNPKRSSTQEGCHQKLLEAVALQGLSVLAGTGYAAIEEVVSAQTARLENDFASFSDASSGNSRFRANNRSGSSGNSCCSPDTNESNACDASSNGSGSCSDSSDSGCGGGCGGCGGD